MIKAVSAKNLRRLLVCLAISMGVGGLSSLITRNTYNFYSTLEKPFFSPPAYVFGIVWTILYILMGIASYLVVKDGIDKPGVTEAIKLYLFNLFLLFIWPIIFFNFQLIGISAIIIILTLFVSANVAWKFYEINKTAGYLMLPLVLWILFASVLNILIWWLNR